ncbi:MAG: isoleucine--tRNA ligase [Candidatus Marinimicrobia bacterium]|nr:isoleucine--tRNA ligase [Candidatus Neomarinimicrobiota bacterium]MBT4359504.1 isoleucine--tRNA ligase [Candidatus Neomarinimicrobiota bacterium]MBT4715482.1 isoleucine--tRNA ligase [Candidatus Neomarinimicrobiota bacterium]MBT4947614.1 isoleucine--tRNA ligase [Candidatus Neomarinimicrobiota bacterium]MBT5268870.1 isoleucine--tRNA ligase [Candidatus Neomarinimicrobiota bacterium]
MMKEVSSKVDFIALEHDMLKLWEDEDIFNKLKAQNAGKPRWSFLDGPITANNPMGVHHAWGRTYKDLFQRYHAMLGMELRYQNGFDCQGLWVEVEVEKELGFKSKTDIEEYGIEAFVNKCKERVHKFSAIQTEQSKRMGYWMDWDNSYYTMSDENNYTIWAFLKKCFDRGFIYKGYDVMPWCTRCGSALSEHEIATEGYKELTHTSIYLKFPLKDRDNESLLVWTTTPWTLSSNIMAAVHPDLDYVKVKQGDDIYYLVQGRLSILQGDYEILETLKGKDMLGWEYHGPYDELPIQKDIHHAIIFWDEISENDGTGIVHIAPGCGKEDNALAKELGFQVIKPIDEFGAYLEGFGEWTGKNVMEIGDAVIDDLSQKGLRYKREPITHRYPCCWRHGTELVFRPVDEWFIRMDELRGEIAEVTKKVDWIPSYGKERELDWLKNMHDWMISKKRYWGLALPIWTFEDGSFYVVGSEIELKELAVEGWEDFEGQSPHKPWIDHVKIKHPETGLIGTRVPDVGNPWLDAGIVPYSTLEYRNDPDYWEKWFPADFIVESLPGQFRNWFYAILAMSTVMEKKPPIKTIMGHALVKDEHGDDMHKSAGNAIWFEDAAEKMGVDVMRWMYASQVPVNNLNFGYHAADEVRRKVLTLWNTYSFFVTYARLDKFDPMSALNESTLTELDRWILARLNQLVGQARKDYDSYQADKLMLKINRFVDELSNWYVRRSRRRFWKSENDTDKWAAYHTLYQALVTLSKLIAPISPFFTEALYQNLVVALDPEAPGSIHLCSFPEVDERRLDDELLRRVDVVIKTVELGRAARNKANLKVRQPLANISVYFPGEQDRAFASDLQGQILEELNIKTLTVVENADDLVQYDIKPNLGLLGPKYGKDMGLIRNLINAVEPQELLKQSKAGDSIHLSDGDKTFELLPEELFVSTIEPEGQAVVEEAGVVVAVETELSEALISEGMARDFIRNVQNMRKDAEFDVSDRISIFVEVDESLKKMILEHQEYIANETLAEEINFAKKEGTFQAESKIGKSTFTVGIKRY